MCFADGGGIVVKWKWCGREVDSRVRKVTEVGRAEWR